MSKTSIIIATVTNKEEKVNGEFKSVKITLESGLQKENVDCHPTKADKINVGDFVEVVCNSNWREYKDNVYHTMQVTSIKKIELPKNANSNDMGLESDNIPF